MKRRIARRPFLQLSLGGMGWLLAKPRVAAAASAYRVGVGSSPDPYTATQRAVEASGEWPTARMAGQTVIVKPNLVAPKPADSGATTDPHVVRALVDLALAAGAARVLIVESGAGPRANFSACGYDLFSTYDAQGRVMLVNLFAVPVVPATVPGGLAYQQLYLPRLLLDPNAVFVSAAKLKCHGLATATLTVKNLYGLPSPRNYYTATQALALARNAMHTRGMDQAAVDVLLARPVDFGVVDGVWGMEGDGPILGSSVRMDVVVAGRNAVAIDRVCLAAMGIPQASVPHLAYATLRGLGPRDLGPVEVRGDSYTPRTFQPALVPPTLWLPVASPGAFSATGGQQTTIRYRVEAACSTRVDIVRTSESSPAVTPVRALQVWTHGPAGVRGVAWDGRDDAGELVPPGAYRAQVQARYDDGGRIAYVTDRVAVIA